MSGTVLFVDDEQSILNALERVFADNSAVSVVTAKDGEAALEVLATQPVDMLISDQLMPGMSGTALLSKVRQLYPDIPGALLTGTTDIDRQELSDLGDELVVIDKPWETKSLRKLVTDTLAMKQMGQEEEELMRHGISFDQLRRAQRIRDRMQTPQPLGEVLIQLGDLTREKLDEIVQARRSRLELADLLHEDGFLSREDLAAFQAAKRRAPEMDDRKLLVDNHLVTEEQFLRALAVKHAIPWVEPEVAEIDDTILARSSVRYLMRQEALPYRMEDHQLRVILADPLNHHLLTELERIFGVPISPCCCTADKICEALRTLERLRGGADGEESASLQYRSIDDMPDNEDISEEAVQMVDYLLLRAIQLKASDLHIEPRQRKIHVRARVDGVLQKLTDLPSDIGTRLASRVKILAGMDIAEKRLHQDGKIFVKVEGSEVDIRVSSYVTIHGENLVLRLLDRNRNLMDLDSIGFAPKMRSLIDDIVLRTSSGLVLVTGPTGSGKTTTLYSFIGHALDPEEKIITCEDPVEYVIDGIIQCSVNDKTGPTFGDSLRAIVRQDPDTIVVGEVRDGTTANLAFESALTGHKVFSTFHTEDAVTVVIRLLEMGVEPFLVSSTLSAVIAQRLVRRLCTRCRKPGQPGRTEMRFLGLEKAELRGVKLYDAVGCPHCEGTGYRGRLGIHEVLVPHDDFRDAVLRRASAKDLREQARTLPEFLTLQEDALLKVVAGRTTLSEIVANVPRDINARPLSTLKSIAGIGRKE